MPDPVVGGWLRIKQDGPRETVMNTCRARDTPEFGMDAQDCCLTEKTIDRFR